MPALIACEMSLVCSGVRHCYSQCLRGTGVGGVLCSSRYLYFTYGAFEARHVGALVQSLTGT